jgi:hypothetical protein
MQMRNFLSTVGVRSQMEENFRPILKDSIPDLLMALQIAYHVSKIPAVLDFSNPILGTRNAAHHSPGLQQLLR